jgi:hypothetical protein
MNNNSSNNNWNNKRFFVTLICKSCNSVVGRCQVQRSPTMVSGAGAYNVKAGGKINSDAEAASSG